MKVMKASSTQDEAQLKDIKHEVQLMTDITDENFIKVYEAEFNQKRGVGIVLMQQAEERLANVID